MAAEVNDAYTRDKETKISIAGKNCRHIIGIDRVFPFNLSLRLVG